MASNGIAKNPLNDISKVYLETIATEGYDKPDEKLKTDRDGYSIPKADQMSAAERIKKKTAEKRAALEKKHGKKMDDHPEYPKKKYVDEKLDPVGQEDKDIDNDGDVDKSDKYLHKRRKAISAAMKKRMSEAKVEVPSGNVEKLAKAAMKRVDADVDGDVDSSDMKSKEMGEFVPSADGKKKVKTAAAFESYSWRNDLSEVMTDVEMKKEVKEKKVNNKITINPKLGEAVEELRGTLLEEIEIEEIDLIVGEIYEELIEEGFSEDEVEFGIESALNTLEEASDAYYDSAVKAGKKKRSMKDRVKSGAKKAIFGLAKGVGKAAKTARAVQAAPGKAKRKVSGLVDKVKAAARAGYEAGREKPKASTSYRGAGAGRKEKIGEQNQGPSTPVKMYDGKMMPNSGAGRIKNVRPKGSAALRLAHTEHEGDVVQEMGGPALPGEPGRPGTPKAPGGRPHLPGEKQTPKPKKAGMLRLAHYEADGELVDENVATGKAKRAKRGGIAQKVGAGEVVSNKEKDAAYAKKKAADAASDAAAGDAAHKAATEKGMSPAEAMMRKKAAERKAARARAKAMK